MNAASKLVGLGDGGGREKGELRYEKEGLSWEQYVLQSNCSVFYRTWSLGYPAYDTAEM